jgi:hypothetical protein
MYIGIVLMCVDCVLASLRIAQSDPGRKPPPWGGSVTSGNSLWNPGWTPDMAGVGGLTQVKAD